MKADRAYPALDAIACPNTAASCAEVAADRDRHLVARAAHGDRGAFETLLRRHYELMYRVSWRLTGSRTDAQDITQEVCCTLVERIGSFKGEARFTTWLVGIVRNACHDHHRRGSALTRLRRHLSVVAGLQHPPDGRDLYRRT